MLGKTNITTVKGGTIVSDVAEYEWNSINLSGAMGTFVKAVYENNTLVGITKDGTIAYTKDGENWENRRLDLEDNYTLNDLVWDGKRFVFVGSHTDNSTYISALVAMSEDLIDYDIKTEVNEKEYFGLPSGYTSFLCVMVKDGEYNIITVHFMKSGSSGTVWEYHYYAVSTDLESYAHKNYIFKTGGGYAGHEKSQEMIIFNSVTIDFSKNNDRVIAYIKCSCYNSASKHFICASSDGKSYSCILETSGELMDLSNIFSVFGCKGNQYYISTRSAFDYKLVKLSENSESSDITTGIDFGFVDAVYFNKCEIYINRHQMLIVKTGENISDKTLDDLIEITYDFSMASIVKAFDKLYVFGSNGNIMVSSNEIKNGESVSVRTMSAMKALYDAKAYTDEKYAELEARIAEIEESRLNQ